VSPQQMLEAIASRPANSRVLWGDIRMVLQVMRAQQAQIREIAGAVQEVADAFHLKTAASLCRRIAEDE